MTDTTGTIKIGETKFLPLTVTPPDGDTSSLAYSVNADGFVVISPVVQDGKPKGLSAKGLAAGDVDIRAQVGNIVSICHVKVIPAIPLVTALVLGPPS